MAKGKYEQWLTAEGLLQLEAWARNGLTDEQIAKNMGVSVATLYNYKKVYLEILEALKKGKEVLIYRLKMPYSKVHWVINIRKLPKKAYLTQEIKNLNLGFQRKLLRKCKVILQHKYSG